MLCCCTTPNPNAAVRCRNYASLWGVLTEFAVPHLNSLLQRAIKHLGNEVAYKQTICHKNCDLRPVTQNAPAFKNDPFSNHIFEVITNPYVPHVKSLI
jgi:hypothetical protein